MLAVAGFLAAVVVYVVVAAPMYSDFTHARAYVPLLPVGATGFISLSWWRDRVNMVAVEESLRRKREQFEPRLEDGEQALDRKHQLGSRGGASGGDELAPGVVWSDHTRVA